MGARRYTTDRGGSLLINPVRHAPTVPPHPRTSRPVPPYYFLPVPRRSLPPQTPPLDLAAGGANREVGGEEGRAAERIGHGYELLWRPRLTRASVHGGKLCRIRAREECMRKISRNAQHVAEVWAGFWVGSVWVPAGFRVGSSGVPRGFQGVNTGFGLF